MFFKNHHLETAQLGCLDWSVIRSFKEGESDCGDTYLVKESNDKVLIAVIDGLGHGMKAAEASSKAVELLDMYRSNQSLINLIKTCHKGLRSTRGVVMGLALINFWEHTVSWIGVGNIEGILILDDGGNHTQTYRMIQRSGIIGHNLPFLQVSTVSVSVGDLLIFTTDGVQNNFLENVDYEVTTKEIVEKSRASFKESDDALILAARYRGGENL